MANGEDPTKIEVEQFKRKRKYNAKNNKNKKEREVI